MRKILKDNWQQGEPKLIMDLNDSSGVHPISDEDESILPLAVSAALAGLDVAEYYPRFYRRMLASPGLQEAFVDALASLEEERSPEALPQESRKENPVEALLKPLIEKLAPNRWRIHWEPGLDGLQAAFFPAALPAIRDGDPSLEDVRLTLLRSQGQAAGLTFDILLNAVQKLESPQLLYPVALVSAEPDTPSAPAAASPAPGLKLRLQWGGYQAEAEVDPQGRASFPPLPRQLILDDPGKRVTAPLSLTLEAAPA